MLLRIINSIFKIVLLACCALFLMGADSPTIYPNPGFPQSYNVSAGQNYSKGGQLTFKMVKIDNPTQGLFDSHEGTQLAARVSTVTGLPPGLTWDQSGSPYPPADNTFYIYGTVPVETTPGVYQVNVNAYDAINPQYTGTQVLYLTVGSVVPQPTQPVQIVGNVGDDSSTAGSMSQYFQVPSGAAIDQYQVVNPDALPAGVTLDTTSGIFNGKYQQPTPTPVPVVNVIAHNAYGWTPAATSSLLVTFSISQPDTVPYITAPYPPVTATVNTPNALSSLSNNFAAPSTSPITSYLALDPLPDNITLNTDGSFTGSYGTVQQLSTRVVAINKIGQSNPLTISFNIVAADAPPTPDPAQNPLSVVAHVKDTVNIKDMGNFFINTGSPITSFVIVNSNLPDLIKMDQSSGKFSGQYTTPGTTSTHIDAINAAGQSKDFIINFTVKAQDTAPTPTTGSLSFPGIHNNPVQADAMSKYFTVNDPTDPVTSYTYDVLPQGITFDKTQGTFSGFYPAASQTPYTVNIQAQNNAGLSTPIAVNFNVDALPWADTSPFDILGVMGQAMQQSVSTGFQKESGASNITQYNVVASDPLPPGITGFDTATGTFSGTYSQGGVWNVRVNASNNAGPTATPLVVNFSVNSPPMLHNTTLQEDGTTGQQNVSVDVSGNFYLNPAGGATAIMSYSATGNIPSTLTFDTTSGKFTGSYPTTAQDYVVTVTAHNLAGDSQPATITFHVTQSATSTLLCPNLAQLQQPNNTCPQSVTVQDSNGVSHTFTQHYCDALSLVKFLEANLRYVNSNYPNGLECVYESNGGGASASYYIDPAPTGMYYGNNQTSAQCTGGADETSCPMNLP